jgi:protein gp37
MAGLSTIDWTEFTWNVFRGCSRISPGCENCYAEAQGGRFSGPGLPFEGFVKRTSEGFRWTRNVELIESMLDWPRKWKKPKVIFVNSMSDLFHEAIPLKDIQRVFNVMVECPQHEYQILPTLPQAR